MVSIASPSSPIARDGTPRARYDVGVPLGLALLVVLGTALLGAAAPRSTDIVAVDDFIDAPRALFGRTRAAVERALGAPLSVRPRVLPGGPTSAAEAVDELLYPGLTVAVSQRSGVMRRVAITEPRWSLPRGLNVGTARPQVETVLGEPQLVADASVLYLDADGFPNTVEFHFRDDRVRRIEWSYAPAD
jgi:hypothetical protein